MKSKHTFMVLCGSMLMLVHAAEEQIPVYDPLQGMEESGLIRGVVRPDDVAHPERWRYIPAGRIKPGSVFERFMVSSFFTPIVFFEEDVGAGGGVGFTDIDFRNQQRQEFLGAWASITSEGQQTYRGVWKRHLAHRELPDGGVLFEEHSEVRVEAGYNKSLTTRFFGLGSDSTADDETSYTDEQSAIGVSIAHGLPHAGDSFIGHCGLRYQYHSLHQGKVSSRPSMDEVHPQLFDAGDGHGALWLTVGIAYDERDSAHQPYRGWKVGMQTTMTVLQTNGDWGAVSSLDGSCAIPIASLFHDGGEVGEENPPTDSIAVGAVVAATSGDLPFYYYPSLGGENTQRGYIQNRWSDRAAWHATVEWRTWPWPRGHALTDSIRIERFGLALFYDIGAVAPRLADVFAEELVHSYGVGFRIAFERTAVFRLDLGFSDEGSSFNADFGLSF